MARGVQRQPGKRSRDGATNGQGDRRNTTKEAKPLAPVRAPVSGDGERSFAPREEAQGKATRLMVDCGDPWAWETIEAAVEKGAHKSATSDESIALVKEDVAYQVLEGTAQAAPKQLKIAALAVVPQRNRRGRMILDLSFAVSSHKATTTRAQRPQHHPSLSERHHRAIGT